MPEKTYVILDLEWNGTYSRRIKGFINEIIEFGAVKVDESLNILDTYEALVRPQVGKKISGKIRTLTSITNEELEGGLTATNLFGISGFETTLPLALEMVRLGVTDMSYIIRCMTVNPARIIRLYDRGTLSVGADADVTVFDPDKEWVVTRECLHSKGPNNPYIGDTMRGRVELVIIGGEIVCRDWKILKQVEKPC